VTFIGDFYKYMKTRTDAPPDFFIQGAIAALAYVMGTNVTCLDGWSRPIYPNMWIAIIARSGMGKSTPLDMSKSLVERASLGEGIFPEQFSQEALFSHMSAHSTGILYIQEFSAFMGAIHREYNAGTEQFLTKIYDVPDVEQRITMKKDEGLINIYKPCITILAASSPDWFAESFKGSSLRGGFLARFMFCPNNEPGEYVGLPGPRDESTEIGLADHLREVSRMSGRMDFSQVRQKFTEWDRVNRQKLREEYSPDFGGMRSRAGLMVLKASMIFHASADPSSMTITDKDLDQAIRYVERTHAMAEAYLSEEVAGDRYEGQRIKLLEIIRSHNGHVTWTEALRESRMSTREFRSAVETLRESGRVIVEPGIGRQRYLRLPETPKPLQ